MFDEDGLTLTQNLKWTASVPVTQLYMTMLTPAKKDGSLPITNKLYTDTDFSIFTPTDPVATTNFPNAKMITLFASESGVFCGFELLEYPTGLAGGDRLNLSDNGGLNYNKIYASAIETSSPVMSVVGDNLKAKTRFILEMGEGTAI